MRWKQYITSLLVADITEGNAVTVSVLRLLKLKNEVASFARTLQQTLTKENSVMEGQTREHNLSEVMDDLIEAKSFLVKLKTLLAQANSESGALAHIYRMEELKDDISFLQELPTKSGTHFVQTSTYSETTVEKVFEAHLTNKSVGSELQALQLAIVSEEASLLECNAAKKVSVELPN